MAVDDAVASGEDLTHPEPQRLMSATARGPSGPGRAEPATVPKASGLTRIVFNRKHDASVHLRFVFEQLKQLATIDEFNRPWSAESR